jgi:hypothetical protein
VIPSALEYIGNWMFAGCSSLSEVIFEKNSSLKAIGSKSFHECEKLEYIEIPNSVLEIGDHCFYYSGLKELKLPN